MSWPGQAKGHQLHDDSVHALRGFQLPRHPLPLFQVDFGEGFKVVGNQQFLGSWEPKQGLELKWTDGHVWTQTVQVPVGVEVCFKVGR